MADNTNYLDLISRLESQMRESGALLSMPPAGTLLVSLPNGQTVRVRNTCGFCGKPNYSSLECPGCSASLVA